MDEITLPVQYESLNIEGLRLHLRHITNLPKSGHCAEIFLCDSKVVIPVVKKIYKTKSDKLIFLLRSGSVSRDNLAELKCTFINQNYEFIDSYTTKKKLISRLSLPISVNDPMLTVISVNILKEVTMQLKSGWPDSISIGYALGDENTALPGLLKYRDLIAQAGYKIGIAAGRAKKLIMP